MSYARNQLKKLKRRKRTLPEDVFKHGQQVSWHAAMLKQQRKTR